MSLVKVDCFLGWHNYPLVDFLATIISEDSHFVLPGRGSTASVRMCPGLYIRRKRNVNSANVDNENKPQIMIVDIDLRVKEKEKGMGGGPVFSCEAKSGSYQILAEGSSVPATESFSWRSEKCLA